MHHIHHQQYKSKFCKCWQELLRFVDRDGFIQERFFGVVRVKDTSASTLKEGIFSILSRHNLDVQNILGQGYDGASNMRGEWNGLKALILDECPYAYYVHCFAHRLQLTLVASSKEVIPVHQFFTKLNSTINVVGASCKRNNQLKAAHASNIAHLLSIDELESGRGLNQIVLLNIIEDGTTYMLTVEMPMQLMRDSGWDELLESVKSFCETVNITVPDFDAQYIARRGRARLQQDELTIGHHYKVDIFYAVIDSQLQELSNRFDDKAMELTVLSSSLDPKEMRISFRIDDVCKLVKKFYPQEFEDYEILQLRMQLEHFKHVQQLLDFRTLESISDLCQWLVKTRKSNIYPLVFRVVTLILTLPVSTATTERSFSAINIVKTTLRNKMEDEFLSDCLLVYIEKQIAKQFSIDSIIDDFRDMQERRSKF
ncbi:PREDICTED: zinc finger MYM-type protein 1-like [Ipomoea nil]|uniref:zinc finger MYM-type protein 1-like n=1 Tax=Ipomoea nil TaxID=35883 RepID=UPI0009018D52|nr:PREDICTED: zinc finger MYM-type protein 1-like [Ipomoea nil]